MFMFNIHIRIILFVVIIHNKLKGNFIELMNHKITNGIETIDVFKIYDVFENQFESNE